MSTYVPAQNRLLSSSRPSHIKVRSLHSVTKNHFAFLVVMLVLCGIVFLFTRSSSPESALKYLGSSAKKEAVLVVQSHFVERSHGYFTVLGEVKNVSPKTLSSVEVVVEFFDKDKKLRNVETALIEFSSIQSGEESPFSLKAAEKEGIESYRIRFRHLLGKTIASQ